MRSMDRASMGPRSDERGNFGEKRDPFGTRGALQWGRAQMSAEIRPSGIQASAANLLQWGRAQMSAEMRTTSAPRPHSDPLQWGRAQMSAEISTLSSSEREAALASMGPRSDERGNEKYPEEKLRIDPLQWGRAQMSAEMRDDAPGRPHLTCASMGPRSDERGNSATITLLLSKS